MQKRQTARPPATLDGELPDAHTPKPTPADSPDGPALENPLSEREMEVARLLVTGATNTEIARELTISPHTVKVHLRNVFEKLQVSSRTEASMFLLQRGWVIVPGVEASPTAEPTLQSTLQPTVEPVPEPVPPPPPEPAPLLDQPATIAPWQRIYLSVALALCIIAAFAPFVLGRPRSAFMLLSDAGQTAIGKPSVELLPRWEPRTPLSQARSRMSVALDGQLIYVIGGEGSGGQLLAAVDAYDLQVNQWQSLAALPYPLANSSAALWGGGLFVAGGMTALNAGDVSNAQLSDELLLYLPQTNVWHSAGPLPVPLAGAQLVADDDGLFLLGGWDGTTLHDGVWAWQPSVEDSAALLEGGASSLAEWRLITRLPAPLAFFGAVVADRTLYVAGGYDGRDELADVYTYGLETQTWRTIAPLTTPRGGLSLAHDGVALLALGGGWTRTIPGHERYDPLSNQWTTIASPIPGEWRHLAAVSRDGVIHLLGGWSGDYLDTHLQYQSSFRALLPMITSD